MKSIADVVTFAGGFTRLLSPCLLIISVSASQLLGQVFSVLLDPGHGGSQSGAIGRLFTDREGEGFQFVHNKCIHLQPNAAV